MKKLPQGIDGGYKTVFCLRATGNFSRYTKNTYVWRISRTKVYRILNCTVNRSSWLYYTAAQCTIYTFNLESYGLQWSGLLWREPKHCGVCDVVQGPITRLPKHFEWLSQNCLTFLAFSLSFLDGLAIVFEASFGTLHTSHYCRSELDPFLLSRNFSARFMVSGALQIQKRWHSVHFFLSPFLVHNNSLSFQFRNFTRNSFYIFQKSLSSSAKLFWNCNFKYVFLQTFLMIKKACNTVVRNFSLLKRPSFAFL